MSTIITHRQFPNYHKYEMELAGRPLTLEVGKLAELANAAVMVGYGDTRVLVCATASARPRDGIDFFPLSVDFEEKMYAVGRIPGSFNRREGRPGEKGILTSRVIDRPIRPLFPYDFRNDVSIMATVMAVDHDCSPEIAALIGTSAALAISDIPWNGPIGGVQVGLVDGEIVLNPTKEQRERSDLALTLAASMEKIVMIEAGANEVTEEVMMDAIKAGHEEIKKLLTFMNGIIAEIGKPKKSFTPVELDHALLADVYAKHLEDVKAAMNTDDKNVRDAAMLPIMNGEYVVPVFVSEDGITHRVWLVTDAADIAAIEHVFSEMSQIYIADGHHRAASAVKVGIKRRNANPNHTGEEEYNYFLSVLFPHDQLKILPYNRVVHDLNGYTADAFIDAVKADFEVEAVTEAYQPEEKAAFGMYLDGIWYKLRAKSHILSEDPVDGLDVSILQDHLLAPVLGIEDPRTDKRIDFIGGIRGLSELERRANSDMKLAFSMYPTSIEELFAVADAKRLMPPKSTWFEPKLRSGIFIHKL